MDEPLRDKAIDAAYREHATDVYRVAYGVLRDRDEALDATTDTFARAWERWDQYDSQRPLRAWLHGIVTNLALDQLRRRRVRRLAIPALGNAVVNEITRRTEHDPSSDLVRRSIVDQALETLPPRSRAALVLRHYYGYAYGEIGSLLGMNSGTVGSTLSRAHADLRRRLVGDDAVANDTPPASRRPHARTTDQTTEPPEVLR